MLLRLIEEFIDLEGFKQELRRIGGTFITAGIVGIFLTHLISLALAWWLTFIGSIMVLMGLFKKRGKS